ncbi:MAG: hypothetical protein WHS89_08625 [Acidimicrobiales bacterium]
MSAGVGDDPVQSESGGVGAPDAAGTAQPASGTRRRHRRRRSRLVVGLGVAVLIGLLSLAALVVRGRPPAPRSVDEAIESYRARPAGIAPVGREVELPVFGVYTAVGDGRERLSFQATEQRMGPIMPVTVSPSDPGCFEVRVDYHANHWQTWNYCWRDGTLLDTGGRVFQRFDLVVAAPESLSTSTCDPAVVLRPQMEPGDEWTQSCVIQTPGMGSSSTSGPHRSLGDELLRVGGEDVLTRHVRDERTYSGAQSGTGRVDLWLDAGTGLPVRSEWDLQIESPSPLGTIGYRESGHWTLDSRAPRTDR